jgi:hypothetical protein
LKYLAAGPLSRLGDGESSKKAASRGNFDGSDVEGGALGACDAAGILLGRAFGGRDVVDERAPGGESAGWDGAGVVAEGPRPTSVVTTWSPVPTAVKPPRA